MSVSSPHACQTLSNDGQTEYLWDMNRIRMGGQKPSIGEVEHLVLVHFLVEDVLFVLPKGKGCRVLGVDLHHSLGGILRVDVLASCRHQQASAATQGVIRHGTKGEWGDAARNARVLLIQQAGIMALHATATHKQHGLLGLGKEEIVQAFDIGFVGETDGFLSLVS